MIHKPLSQILLSDLEQLISNAVPEGRTLEYKRQPPGNQDQDKVKFLRTVCAFANTDGGDMVYGLDEHEGLPTTIVGMDRSQVDEYKLRCEQMMLNCIEPRLPKVDIKVVDVNVDRFVLIVRVQRSWLSPHRVTVGNHVHFYGRNSAGTYPLDVSQLREAFAMSDAHADRARRFVTERVLKVEQDKSSVKLREGAKLVLHVIPLSSLSVRNAISLNVNPQDRVNFPLMFQNSRSARANLDGFVIYDRVSGGSSMFTQIFRTGMIETVASYAANNDGTKRLHGTAIEKAILSFLENVFALLQSHTIEGPYIISLAFVHHNDYQLTNGNSYEMEPPLGELGQVTVLPDVMIENWSNVSDGIEMKPLFDAMWNAFEFNGSPNYDANGIRRLRL